MQNRFAFTALAFSGFFSLAACATSEEVHVKGSDTSATAPATDAASFCKALCDRQASCDTSLDEQTCTNACKNQNAAVFPRLRSDVVDGIVACVNEEDCKTVLGAGLVGTCASEAVAKVAPSDQAIAFCDAMASAQSKCGGGSTKAQCLEMAKLYSDDAIAEAANCSSRKCTDIPACVSAVFGSFGTASSSSSTTTTTTSCSSIASAFGPCSSCAQSSCCAEAQACSKDSGCLAIVNTCTSSGSSSSSSCQAALQSYPPSSQQLAGTFYSCAQSKCSTCGSPAF